MTRNKRRKKAPVASPELVKALAEIRRRGNVRSGLATFKLSSDVESLRRILPKLLAMPAYRAMVWPARLPISDRQLWFAGIPAQASFEVELEWAVQSLLMQSGTINAFLDLKRECERLYLLGMSEELEAALDRVEGTLGSSLWLIESRINATQSARGFNEQKAFTHTILSDKSISVLIRYIVSWYSYRSEENMSAPDFYSLVEESIPFDGGFSSLVRVILGTQPVLTLEDAAAAISYCDALSPVDRYLYLVSSVQAVVSGAPSAATLTSVASSLLPLLGAIGDPALKRLLIVCSAGSAGVEADGDLLPLLDAYTSGNREEAAPELGHFIEEEASVDAIVLAARMGSIGDPALGLAGLKPASPLGKIAEDIASTLRGEEAAADAEGRLSKLRLTNASSAWAADLQLILLRLRQDVRIYAPDAAHMYAALRASRDNPVLAFSFKGVDKQRAYLRAFGDQGSRSVTCRLLEFLLNEDDADGLPTVPDTRLARLTAIKSVRQGRDARAIAILDRLLSNAVPVIEEIEARILLAEAYLRCGRFDEAATVCVDLILRSHYHARQVPIQALVDRLIDEEEARPREDLVLGTFPVAILMDLYSRFVSNIRDPEKADAFNDLLERHGVDRPSALPLDGIPRAWQIHFLRYLCVPEVLDQCLALKSTSEVENERASLIVRCADIYNREEELVPDELQNELQEIRTRQVVRETNLKLDQSKIFVDIEGIQAQVASGMRDSWNRYRLLGLQDPGADDLAEITKALEDALGQKLNLPVVSLSLPVTERNKLFSRMIRELRDQFTASKTFGLDANLSTNIRHGYILRELRGPFVAGHLVTNLSSEGGAYQTNDYWLKKFNLDDVAASALSEAFQAFSSCIDTEIETLIRERIRIRTENNPHGLFNFTISDVQLQIIQGDVDGAASSDEFIRLVFDFLWRRTELSLDKVRGHIKEDVLAEFQVALNALQDDIDGALDPSEASAVRQAINLTRPELNAAVDRVASWFTLSTTRDYQDYQLTVAFSAGLATVKSYFSNLDLQADLESLGEVTMRGWTLPHFARLFSILIENAALHSGIKEGVLEIAVRAAQRGDSLEIIVRNQLSDALDQSELLGTVARLNRDFGSEAAADFIRVERGSGYPKIWKILRHDLRRDHVLQVSIADNGEFEVEIIMNKEGVVA